MDAGRIQSKALVLGLAGRLVGLLAIAAIAAWAGGRAFAGVPVPRTRAAQPATTTTTETVTPGVPAKQNPSTVDHLHVDASPQATGQQKLAPAGTTTGSSTPQTNATQHRSPTPPEFPFGAPGGSYAPGGAAISGPEPGFKSNELGH